MQELQASLSRREFLDWSAFYRAHPFDDMHRYHRPAALIACKQGGDIQAALDYLAPEKNPDIPDGLSEADHNTLRALGVMRG